MYLGEGKLAGLPPLPYLFNNLAGLDFMTYKQDNSKGRLSHASHADQHEKSKHESRSTINFHIKGILHLDVGTQIALAEAKDIAGRVVKWLAPVIFTFLTAAGITHYLPNVQQPQMPPQVSGRK